MKLVQFANEFCNQTSEIFFDFYQCLDSEEKCLP